MQRGTSSLRQRSLLGQLFAAQPASRNDAIVERALRIVTHGLGGKAHALIGDAVARGGIQVDADQAGELDLPARFLQRLPDGGLAQVLVSLRGRRVD